MFALDSLWCPFPLTSMLVGFLLCALARALLGLTTHPVEDDANKSTEEVDAPEEKEEEAEKLDSFSILTTSGHMMAQIAILFSLCKLPVALNVTELLHCLAIVVIVQFEMIITKFWCKLVSSTFLPGSVFETIGNSPWRPFLLWPNVVTWGRTHGVVMFFYYVWGILWYESYINMLLAGPLISCGWSLPAVTLVVGLSAGLLNHGIVNGIPNGVKATVFYITMSAMFSVSNSVLSVVVAHALFYFRQLHARNTSVAFAHPLFVVILLVNTGCMFVLLRILHGYLPPAIPLTAPESVANFRIASVGGVFAAGSVLFDCARLSRLIYRHRQSHARESGITEIGDEYAFLDCDWNA